MQRKSAVLAIFFLRRYWDESRTKLGLLVTLALVLGLHSTHATLFYATVRFPIIVVVLGNS